MLRRWMLPFCSLMLALAMLPAAAQTPPAVSSHGQKAGPYGSPIGGVQSYILLGEFQLWGTKDAEFTCDDFGCYGAGQYAYLFGGNSVTVLDPSGTTLAITQLNQVPAASDGEISFEVQALVREETAYTIRIKDGPSITVTKEQLEHDGWAVRRSFGRVPIAGTPAAPPKTRPNASPAASPVASPANDLELGPVVGRGFIEVAAIVHLRGIEGEQFHCLAGLKFCKGLGKYKDIFGGAKVIATDPSGKVLNEAAMIQMPESTEHELVFRALLIVPDIDACSFQFGARAGFPVTRAQFEKTGWTITLILGPAPDA
jgi:hypothetical protein